MSSLNVGDVVWWRFEGGDKAYRVGYVVSTHCEMACIGPHRDAPTDFSTWVDVQDIEWKPKP